MSSRVQLLARVTKLVESFGDLDLRDPERATKALEQRVPITSDLVQDVRADAVHGLEQGWLLDKERNGVRFSRLAQDVGGYSVDVVLLDHQSGPRHRHPDGEIDLLFGIEGAPNFDGHPVGWAVYGPDSEHVPGVRDGKMLILYFLPNGAIEWV